MRINEIHLKINMEIFKKLYQKCEKLKNEIIRFFQISAKYILIMFINTYQFV